MKWLKGLQKAGLSMELKRQINWAFDNENASEIYFVLIPSDQIGLGPFPPSLMGSTAVIMISTVEIDHIPAFLEQQRARLAARRKKKL